MARDFQRTITASTATSKSSEKRLTEKGSKTTGGLSRSKRRRGPAISHGIRGPTFAVAVRKEDLEYWNGLHIPVLFIYYHPAEDKLYCKEVKSYFKARPTPSAHRTGSGSRRRRTSSAPRAYPLRYAVMRMSSPPRVSHFSNGNGYSPICCSISSCLFRCMRHAATTVQVHQAGPSRTEGGLRTVLHR